MKYFKSLNQIDRHEWLILSNKKQIIQRISSDHYSKAYPILLERTQVKTSKITWDQALFALHVVYGWMPTIPQLKRIMDWPDIEKAKFIDTLNNMLVDKNTDCENFNKVKEFANNSAVGASKLLHFLSDKAFPIWDSRVAKAFFSQENVPYNQINKTSNWKNYTEALREWIGHSDVVIRCEEIRKLSGASFLAKASDIRIVELVLFHKSKSNKK
jgi:hypothetical protein